MAFDGAASMKLLAQKIKQSLSPGAIFIHCFAHSNELVVHDLHGISEMFRDSLDLCQNLYAFVGAYPKRVLLFENIQKDIENETQSDNYDILRLQSLSVTRWTTRAKAAHVLLERLSELNQVLASLQIDKASTADVRAKAKGLLKKLDSKELIFKLIGMYEIVTILETLSKELQSKTLTAESASFSIDVARQKLIKLRTEQEFERIWKKATDVYNVSSKKASDEGRSSFTDQSASNSNQGNEVKVQKERKRQIPRRFGDGESVIEVALSGQTSNISLKTDLKRMYMEALDTAINRFSERFEANQKDFSILKTIEKIIIDAANNIPIADVAISQFQSFCSLSSPALINSDEFEEELKGLPAVIKIYNVTAVTPLTNCTKVSNISEIFNNLPVAKQSMPQLHKLLQYYFTVPLCSATAERTFSAMRRLKSWLRSKSGPNHLNNIMFGTIHKARLDDLNMMKISKEFVTANDTRIAYFGKM